MPELITTLGPKSLADLGPGVILPHEHVFVDLRTPDHPDQAPVLAEEVIALMVPELDRARAAGVVARAARGRQFPAAQSSCLPESSSRFTSPALRPGSGAHSKTGTHPVRPENLICALDDWIRTDETPFSAASGAASHPGVATMAAWRSRGQSQARPPYIEGAAARVWPHAKPCCLLTHPRPGFVWQRNHLYLSGLGGRPRSAKTESG